MARTDTLFSLSKISEGQQVSDQAIHTVNFYSPEKTNLDEIPGLSVYFKDKIKFLQLCYDFAKWFRVTKNQKFSDDLQTKNALQEYLREHEVEYPSVHLETGTQFGVLTTKIVESIKSIEKNQFLADFQKNLKAQLALVDHKDLQNTDRLTKEQKKERDKLIKYYKLSIGDVRNFTSDQLLFALNYEVINTATTLRALLRDIYQTDTIPQEFGFELAQEIIINIDKLLSELKDIIESSYNIARQTIEESQATKNDTFLEILALTFYFTFDTPAREIEEKLTPEINSKLNEYKQNLIHSILEGNPDLSDENQKNVQRLWYFNWTDSNSVEKFCKALNKILQNTTLGEDSKLIPIKDENNFFLQHPKSAPSFPSGGFKMKSWSSESRTSPTLNTKSDNFSSLQFFDYTFIRSKRIIENSNVYRLWRFVSQKERKNQPELETKVEEEVSLMEWCEWLNQLITKEKVELDPKSIETFYQNGNQRIILQKKHSRRSKNSISTHIYELIAQYPDEKENKKIDPITIITNSEELPDKVTEILNYASKQFRTLVQDNPELRILCDLQKSGINVTHYLKEWRYHIMGDEFRLITKVDQKKYRDLLRLFAQTQKRRELLKSAKFAESFDSTFVIEYCTEQLTKIEKHLLLDNNHEEFQIFDKLAFSRYRRLSEIVWQSVYEDTKEFATNKHLLAEYVGESELVLPIKIDRMTANRPNGKSTLVFEVDIKRKEESKYIEVGSIQTTKANVIVYPIELPLSEGKKALVYTNYQDAITKFKKGGFTRILAGFLNGSSDNKALQRVIKVNGKDDKIEKDIPKEYDTDEKIKAFADEFIGRGEYGEGGKGYRVYGSFELFYEDSEISVMDNYRKPYNESAGATNPAGYPELTYFLIPELCSNLIVPVETNLYYLTKYTPYHHIKKYFEYEKEVFEDLQKVNAKLSDAKKYPEIVAKIKNILEIRTKLRSFYRVSSLEVDIIKTPKLDTNKGNPLIKPFYSASVHIQFGNPKKELTISPDFRQFDHIISVDLGEKHFAVATISTVNWAEWERGEFAIRKQKILKPIAQTFLPLAAKKAMSSEYEKDQSKDSAFSIFVNKIESKKDNDVIRIPHDQDTTFQHWEDMEKRYKASQARFGSAPMHMRNMRDNFTNETSQIIATQLAKLADKYNAAIVFENLATGFGRPGVVKIYTEVRRLTALKITKIGRANVDDLLSWDDKCRTYELSNEGYNNLSLGFAMPAYTSQTCSNCGFVARQKIGDTIQFTIDEEEYDAGTLIIKYYNRPILKIETNKKLDYTTWKAYSNYDSEYVEEKYWGWRDITSDIQNQISFSKNFNKQTQTSPVLESLSRFLFTEKTNQYRTFESLKEEEFMKFLLKEILKPRKKQDIFECPNCASQFNADYNGSFNIGYHFLVGQWLMLNDPRFVKQGTKDATRKGITNAIALEIL